MDDLEAEANRLRALITTTPTRKTRAVVRAALNSKWEGNQSIALRVLSTWGEREDAETIKSFLIEAFPRQYGWNIRGVAVRALGPLVSDLDADWVLDLYFGQPGSLGKHGVLPLVLKLRPERARKRLVAELRSADPSRRHAAVKAIGNIPYDDRKRLLTPFLDDADRRVRDSARALAGLEVPLRSR